MVIWERSYMYLGRNDVENIDLEWEFDGLGVIGLML